MKLIPVNYQWADIEEYAVYTGMLQAAKGLPISNTLFTFNGKVANELRFIYELAYLMELESGQFKYECTFETTGVVVDWDDLKGWGSIKYGTSTVQFSYTDLDQDFIEVGEIVHLTLHMTSEGFVAGKIITRNELLWKTPQVSPKDA